jgi:DNA-binding LytR/AlgR family response regulator
MRDGEGPPNLITALIAEDEPLAMARLRRLLESQEVQVIGEADNGALALRLADDLAPDLIFLDIRMPGLSGMELAEAISQLEASPLVVFVTGFSEYALSAFENDALDYLTKPVTADRLAITLARARSRLADKQARNQARPGADGRTAHGSSLRSLPIRGDYAVRFVPVRQIVCAVARDKRVYVRTRDGEFRTYYTLTQLEALLNGDRFLRIHDSSLVNIDAIVELNFLGDHAYEVRLTNGQTLRVGRTRYAELQRHVGMNSRPG